jgi:hypothetical protein
MRMGAQKESKMMGWLRQDASRVLSSMFFRRGARMEYVRSGSTFQRVHADDLIETAQVESVGTDAYGIPHVKFKVSFRRPNRNTFEEGSRLLALKTFADRYKDRVHA